MGNTGPVSLGTQLATQHAVIRNEPASAAFANTDDWNKQQLSPDEFISWVKAGRWDALQATGYEFPVGSKQEAEKLRSRITRYLRLAGKGYSSQTRSDNDGTVLIILLDKN